MNWELIHRVRRARRELQPELLEHTQRMRHCIDVADRLAELSAAVSGVAGQRGDWDTVAAALCRIIADAGVALDAISPDAAFELDRHLQHIACKTPAGPLVATLQCAALLSPALLQPPRAA